MATDFRPLETQLPGRLRRGEPLARHTSFRIGGPAEAWVEAADESELAACVAFARDAAVPLTLLAGGTNVLVRDGGIRGLVVGLSGAFERVEVEGTHVRAGAAVPLAVLARRTALAGLKGLEWAVGIPGSLGGGLVMNAGAHGGELKDVVRSVRLLVDGRPETWDAARCGFTYRGSAFQGVPAAQRVLVGADLELAEAPVEALKRAMEEATARRRATQPQGIPNAGCVFKNPEGDSAGRLIEACGLKGRAVGGARFSEIHANFVVNGGGATAADVLALMAEARAAVRERFGKELRDEILVLGEDA